LPNDGHKQTAWECRRCGRIPNAEKLAIIWAKIFKIWAKYTATFTCNEVVYISKLRQNNNQIKGKIIAKTILDYFAIVFAPDIKINTAL